MASPFYGNYYGSNEPQDIYGKKTSSEGNYVVTDRKRVSYTVGAGRDGIQRRNKTVNVYSWQPKQQEAAPAPAPAAPTQQPQPQTPQTPTNVYQPEIDQTQGRIDNSAAQAAQFASQLAQMQQNYQSQIAAQAAQQQRYLNDLRIQQDTRMNQMAAEQKAAAEKLEVGQRTYQQNQARASQLGALQIAGSSETPRTGGTQGFKRRKLQINPVTANALEGILGGSKAATTTNTLNV